MQRIPRSQIVYGYDRSLAPVLTVEPGASLVFETQDPRAGALFELGPGPVIDLPPPPAAGVNPVTGPVQVAGAEPGDVLVAEVGAIRLLSPGYVAVKPGFGPLPAGWLERGQARFMPVDGEWVQFAGDIRVPVRPMIGCIGTAPAGAGVSTQLPGDHGGNMDHRTITTGTRVYLPVQVPGALFALGDVHAIMGDGELSCFGVEIQAEVAVTLRLLKGRTLRRPVLETADTIATVGHGADFAVAREMATVDMVHFLQERLGLDKAAALMLVSAAGDLRIGQACGGMELTLRLEMPKLPGLALG